MKKPLVFYITKALYPGGCWYYIINTNNPSNSEKEFAITEKMFAEDNEFNHSGNKITDMIRDYLERELNDEYTKIDFKFVFNTEFSIHGDVHPVMQNNAGFKFNSHQTRSSMRVPINEIEVKFFYGLVNERILNLDCKK